MRSAERRLAPALAALACALVSGCASISDTMLAARSQVESLVAPAAAPAPAAKAPVAVAVATPAPLATLAVKPPAPLDRDVEAPVPPAAQRAYDDALQLLRAGRSVDAERALRALAQAHPALGGPQANLGLIHRQAGRLDDAVAAFEAAVQANPRQAVFHNQLGVSYRLAGRFDKARAAYERAIELDAQYAAPLLNLGILLDLYVNDPAGALAHYDRYLALTPGGDATVTKWVADLKNRKARTSQLAAKEKP